MAKIGPEIGTAPNDQGALHNVTIDKFKATFPSVPAEAALTDYFLEAYFDKAEGGDFWKGKIFEI